MDDRIAKQLLEGNLLQRLESSERRLALLEKLATYAFQFQPPPSPGTPPGSPGGVDTSVQYNDGGLFGGDANLLWDKTLQVLTVNATITSPEAFGLSVLGGDGAGTGDSDGGFVSLIAGDGGATEGDGGAVDIQSGAAQGTDSNGGDVNITPGAGTGTGTDGIVTINGDVHFENDNMIWDKTAQTLTMLGTGAPNIQGTESTGLLLFGGAAVTADTAGGDIAILGGTGDGTGDGGTAGVVGGLPGQTGNSGNVDIHTPNGGNEGGNAGDISITGGDGVNGYNGDGGSINLTPGTGAGTGVDGIVSVNNSDLHILGTGATGLVLYDATLAAYYRITLDNGVLIITAV